MSSKDEASKWLSKSKKINTHSSILESLKHEEIEGLIQIRSFREWLFWIVVGGFIVSILFDIALVIFQGFKFFGFSLDAWDFRVAIAASIAGGVYLARVLVISLFPKNNNKTTH